jgi:hypothetical protein
MNANNEDNITDDIMAVETEDIDDEINQILKRCNELQSHFYESSKTIQELNTLVERQKNIIIKYDNWTGDFDELLEKLHNSALEGIKEDGNNNFGEKLLEVLDGAVFIN